MIRTRWAHRQQYETDYYVIKRSFQQKNLWVFDSKISCEFFTIHATESYIEDNYKRRNPMSEARPTMVRTKFSNGRKLVSMV